MIPSFFTDANGCWIWTKATRTNGYGMMWDKDKQKPVTAHRYVYESLAGTIPEGLVIDHLCRVRICLNPAHMEVVTNGTNIRRGFSPSAVNGRKTECPRGHLYDEKNTRIETSGKRACRACNHARYIKVRDAARAAIEGAEDE